MLDLQNVQEYANLSLIARQMVEGFITGLHKSPYHGFSVEFAEHLLYNPGESTRHIDWKVYGRTDRLYVKRYEEETNLRALLILDTSSSMYYPLKTNLKLRFSILAAAALMHIFKSQRDAVGLCTFSDQIKNFTKISSKASHIQNLFTQLNQQFTMTLNHQKTNLSEVLHQIAKRVHRCSLIIIFSDMFDNRENFNPLFNALQHLKYQKNEVILFHMFDKQTELDFDFVEKPTIFVDLESGQEEYVQPAEIKDYYIQKIQVYFQQIKDICGQYKIDFVSVDVQAHLDQVLLPYLIKRKRMR